MNTNMPLRKHRRCDACAVFNELAGLAGHDLSCEAASVG